MYQNQMAPMSQSQEMSLGWQSKSLSPQMMPVIVHEPLIPIMFDIHVVNLAVFMLWNHHGDFLLPHLGPQITVLWPKYYPLADILLKVPIPTKYPQKYLPADISHNVTSSGYSQYSLTEIPCLFTVLWATARLPQIITRSRLKFYWSM